MSVLVSGHLSQTQDGVEALEAVVMSLLVGVGAAIHSAVLGWGELLETGLHDRVRLLMLTPVSHDFVRVRAHKVALEAMEVGRLVLHCS